MKWLIEFLRKPRFKTTDEDKADRSRFQWGWGWEWDAEIVEDDEMYWTLSILGIINGLPIITKYYRLFVMDAERLDAGGWDYNKATIQIKNWKKVQEEMNAIAMKRLAAGSAEGFNRLLKEVQRGNNPEV